MEKTKPTETKKQRPQKKKSLQAFNFPNRPALAKELNHKYVDIETNHFEVQIQAMDTPIELYSVKVQSMGNQVLPDDSR